MTTIDEIRKRLAETPVQTVKYPSMDGLVDREYGPTFNHVEMRLVLEALDKVTKERDDAWFTLDNSR